MKFVLDALFMRHAYWFVRRAGPMPPQPPAVPKLIISRSRKWRGSATLFDPAKAEIRLSRTLIKDAGEGLAMMAHEMLHLAQSMAEEDGDDFHGPWFRKHGKRLCRYYGWSHEQFGLRG